MLNSPISACGLNRNPQNIYTYSSGYDPAPSLISNHFSIFEMASIKKKGIDKMKSPRQKPEVCCLRRVEVQTGAVRLKKAFMLKASFSRTAIR